MNKEQLYLALQTALGAVGEVACQSAPDIFFEHDEESPRVNGWARRSAIQLCQRCPVRRICLEYAIVGNENEGIWGATNPAQRRELRRQRKAAAA